MFSFIHYYEKGSFHVIIIVTVIVMVTTIFLSMHAPSTIEGTQKCSLCTIESVSDKISKDFSLSNSSKLRVKRLPQAIIIGSRKSGTRALLQFLQINPAIRAASREVHYFDRSRNYKLGVDWYRSQMPESTTEEITIEKSPAYFVTKGVPERIRGMNSSIKLILIFRDPVTRLISDYSQIVANRVENDLKVEENSHAKANLDNHTENWNYVSSELAWEAAKKGFEDYVRRSDGRIDEQRRAVKTSMFSVYLERWESVFSKSQFHYVDGEILIKNPYQELHKLEIFLGLKPAIKPENFIFNQKKGFYCSLFNTTLFTTKDFKLRKPNTTINCLSRSKGRRHVAVKRELTEELQRFFEPYNEYLYSLTGRNFNWMKADQ